MRIFKFKWGEKHLEELMNIFGSSSLGELKRELYKKNEPFVADDLKNILDNKEFNVWSDNFIVDIFNKNLSEIVENSFKNVYKKLIINIDKYMMQSKFEKTNKLLKTIFTDIFDGERNLNNINNYLCWLEYVSQRELNSKLEFRLENYDSIGFANFLKSNKFYDVDKVIWMFSVPDEDIEKNSYLNIKNIKKYKDLIDFDFLELCAKTKVKIYFKLEKEKLLIKTFEDTKNEYFDWLSQFNLKKYNIVDSNFPVAYINKSDDEGEVVDKRLSYEELKEIENNKKIAQREKQAVDEAIKIYSSLSVDEVNEMKAGIDYKFDNLETGVSEQLSRLEQFNKKINNKLRQKQNICAFESQDDKNNEDLADDEDKNEELSAEVSELVAEAKQFTKTLQNEKRVRRRNEQSDARGEKAVKDE